MVIKIEPGRSYMFSTMRRFHFLSFPGRSKQEAIEQIYRGISRDITRVSSLGDTSYLYQPYFAPNLRGQEQADMTTHDLVAALRDKYPHFVVRAAGKKGILIDWS